MAAEFRAQLQADLQATFSLERELGGGGMSRVFLATENALDRRVVIKTVPGDMLSVDDLPREASVLDLARRRSLTVYDATYLELAHRTKTPLAKLDQALITAAKKEGIPLFKPKANR